MSTHLGRRALEAGTVLPEPSGAEVTWRAIERERGYERLDDDWPDGGDEWKRG